MLKRVRVINKWKAFRRRRFLELLNVSSSNYKIQSTLLLLLRYNLVSLKLLHLLKFVLNSLIQGIIIKATTLRNLLHS